MSILSTYTKIEAGKLPTYGSERLFAAEDVREGQFGYIEAGYRKLEGIENRWLSTYVLTAARALLASRGHLATETHEATRTRGSTP